MKKFTIKSQDSLTAAIRRCLFITPLLFGVSFTDAQALSVNVVAGTGDPLNPSSATFTGSYRWMIQEDQTKDSVPGQPATNENLSFGFHSSYSPVVANGHSTGGTLNLNSPRVEIEGIGTRPAPLDPNKRYFISILPDEGFAMGSAALPIKTIGPDGDQKNVLDPNGTATVVVQPQPIPTAQLSLYIHVDNAPINNAPDLPFEECNQAVPGTCLSGFTVKVFDAGGGYGAVGGQMSTDTFGNPLGTTYQPNGDVAQLGSGSLTTGPDGKLLIKNLAPGKYTIFVDPPAGLDCAINPADGCWQQTATIEGTKGVDAWVKANEPSYFAEFGPPGPHVFIGFVKKGSGPAVNPTSPALTGPAGISGQIVNSHMPRPPEQTFGIGGPVDGCWVGINDSTTQQGLYAGPCDSESRFSISGLEANHIYQLVVWDANLDRIFALRQFTTAANGVLDLGQVPVFDWFAHMNHTVFFDNNLNGFKDPGELGIPGQAINLRFRDGRIYQSNVTDNAGRVEFPEIFPFFHWQVAEVDFARRKATGISTITDHGGIIDTSGTHTLSDFDFTYGGILEPQIQTAANEGSPTADNPYNSGMLASWNTKTSAPCRTVLPWQPATNSPCVQVEGGAPALLQSYQAHMGLTTEVQWGKTNYGPNENGGITGVIVNALTRAEDLPKDAAVDNWEPGIPRVQVALYQDNINNGTGQAGPDKIPDHFVNGVAVAGNWVKADVDNYPLGWSEGGSKGQEDIDRNNDTIFNPGDAINIVHTDAWDDNLPVGCAGDNRFYQRDPATGLEIQPLTPIPGMPGKNQCMDGMRNLQQTRDGVFDGGYGFFSYFPGGMASGSAEATLPAGSYIVEAATPAGYQIQMEEDKNVVFGDSYTPSTLANNLPCIGDTHNAGTELALFPGTPLDPNVFASDIDTLTAGVQSKLCDRKQVVVKNGNAGLNAAANFFMFTEVPLAANVAGVINDDLANTINPATPAFGEKYQVPHLPVSFRDWTGKEITRVYADQNGRYNTLLPSTIAANVPNPSGYSPNMMTACMNDPGPIADADNPGQQVIDPFFDRRYSQFCYTFQFMPGSTTYLDTPVVPVAAFAGPSKNPVDCANENQSPVIYSVQNRQISNFGPYVADNAAVGSNARRLRIVSQGTQTIINPAFDQMSPPSNRNRKTIKRDFGFGGNGGNAQVRLTKYVNGRPDTSVASLNMNKVSWNNSIIVAELPAGVAAGEYQLDIIRNNRKVSKSGVMLTVGGPAPIPVAPGKSIQAAIDAAKNGDLISVSPGSYNEMLVMDKPVRLQGHGAASTIINASKGHSAERLEAWRKRVNDSLCLDPNTGTYPKAGCTPQWDMLPGQAIATLNGNNQAIVFGTEEGAAVTVLASNPAGANPTNVYAADTADNAFANARVDGLSLTSSAQGGGVFVNGYAQNLEIGNNLISSNTGTYGGGIRVGHPNLAVVGAPVDANNDNVSIHHNDVNQNATAQPDAVGGGIALYMGSDNYRVANNQVCGNFSLGHGGGIGHLGLSQNGKIEANTIIFNQSFNQGIAVHGGGIFIGGEPSAAGGLSLGTGSIRVAGNRIQGNQAGAGDGSGIRAEYVNGLDVANSPELPLAWHKLTLVNNIIVNNVAGQAGAISLQDVAYSAIDYNTIANNDSTATAMGAFPPNSVAASLNQPAGIVSYEHSVALDDAIGQSPQVENYHVFANPELVNNIILHNRSFHFESTNGFRLEPSKNPNQTLAQEWTTWDLAVLPAAPERSLSPKYSLLSDGIGCSATLQNPVSPFAPACEPYTPSATNGVAWGNYVVGPASPTFTSEYFNHSPDFIVNSTNQKGVSVFAVAVAVDEGGNQIDVRYNPLTLWNPSGCKVGSAACTRLGDYHITSEIGVDNGATYPRNAGTPFGSVLQIALDTMLFPGYSIATPGLAIDFDGVARGVTRRDMGADEWLP